MKPSIEHFTHPGHSLAEVYGSEEFRCDGCKTLGNGLRYRCHTCNFNMHEYCGVCPSTLSTFMHPHHHLKLVIGTQGRRNNEGFCDLCGDNVEGLFYRCTLCDFDIHPLCAKLPEYVPHALHPTHPLKLQTSSPGWCTVCKSECTSWRYGCRTCSFDIHLECILAQCDASTTSRSVAAPAPWGWDFYGGQAPHVAYHGLAPYGAYHGLAPYGTCHGPAPYGTYHGPSLYYAYGTQHPYCSSTTPPPHCPSPAHFGAYVHPYAYAPPPPYSYGVATPPPPTNYGAAPPPPSYGVAPPPPPPPPPCHGAYAHGESPGFSPHGANHSVSEAQGSGKPSKGGKRLGKIIYSLVGNLTIGLLCGMIFGI